MDATKEWPGILGFGAGATITEELVGQHYRERAKKYHPDTGGTVDDMQQLNRAKELALQWIAGERKRQEELKRAQEISNQHIAAAQNVMHSAYMAQAMAQQDFMRQWSTALTSSAPVEPMPADEPRKRTLWQRMFRT